MMTDIYYILIQSLVGVVLFYIYSNSNNFTHELI